MKEVIPTTAQRDLTQFHMEYIQEYLQNETTSKQDIIDELNEKREQQNIVLIPLDQALKQQDN